MRTIDEELHINRDMEELGMKKISVTFVPGILTDKQMLRRLNIVPVSDSYYLLVLKLSVFSITSTFRAMLMFLRS